MWNFFTPLISCRAPYYPGSLFSLAPSLPAALECQCSLCSLLILTLLLESSQVSARIMYPIVHFPLVPKGPSHTVCPKPHIVSKPTPPPVFHFWLIGSPSTQKSALCPTSHPKGSVSKSWAFSFSHLLIPLWWIIYNSPDILLSFMVLCLHLHHLLGLALLHLPPPRPRLPSKKQFKFSLLYAPCSAHLSAPVCCFSPCSVLNA